MAKIRIRIDAILDVNDTGTRQSILNSMEGLKAKLKRANTRETSTITVEKCYHDETPPKPCEVLSHWEKV